MSPKSPMYKQTAFFEFTNRSWFDETNCGHWTFWGAIGLGDSSYPRRQSSTHPQLWTSQVGASCDCRESFSRSSCGICFDANQKVAKTAIGLGSSAFFRSTVTRKHKAGLAINIEFGRGYHDRVYIRNLGRARRTVFRLSIHNRSKTPAP